jgi:hypothetical protein
MNEREAAIASFDHYGTSVELKDFDKLDDVVIRHDDIVPDRRVVVLRLAAHGADSKCCGLEKHRGQFAATRFYRCDDLSSLFSLIRRGTASGAIERRWGRKITARGTYRDPARSSHGHFVKTSGLRWLSVMALVPVPWTWRGALRTLQHRPRSPSQPILLAKPSSGLAVVAKAQDRRRRRLHFRGARSDRRS